jgi:hypothetical protein
MGWRPPRLGWLAPATGAAVVLGCGVVWLLDARDVRPPAAPGVCFRMDASGAQPTYAKIAEVETLDACAYFLEQRFLADRRPVAGAFQGRFLFVDARLIATSETLKGARWRVFFDPQRAKLDAEISQHAHRADQIILAPPPPPT